MDNYFYWFANEAIDFLFNATSQSIPYHQVGGLNRSRQR
jgi:hypothetical protein